MSNDANITQMFWQPPLISLTAVAHPEVDDGKEGRCFLRADLIVAVQTAVTANKKFNTEEFYPRTSCTHILIQGGWTLSVTESPATVAMLRDKALGHEPPKPSAV